MTLRRALTVMGVVAASSLVASPAQAAPGDAVAQGNAGAATIGQTTVVPVAPCTTEGALEAANGQTSVPDVVSFSNSRSTCTVDEAGEIATATVTGGPFQFQALRQYGGPRIRLASYQARCGTTATGSNSSVDFSGLSGVEVPAEIPANHVVTIPGQDDKPMATVTFNEVHVPKPADGSMTVHLMHIRMFPRGGPTTGDVYVGTVRCSPVS